jgi:hypothetical protein
MTMARSGITALTATAIIISTTAYAESSSKSPPPTQGEIQIVAQKLCKAEPVIGTRLAPKRKCDTPAQLAAYQRQAREIIESYRQRPCMVGAEGGEGQAMSC